MKENIDIIAITESLCKNPAKDYDPVFIISGFECIMNNAGRGTLLFLRNGLIRVQLVHVLFSLVEDAIVYSLSPIVYSFSQRIHSWRQRARDCILH